MPHSLPVESRILIVDDDQDVRQIMSYYLKKLGAQALEVLDGESVLPFLEKQLVDLIILDIMMPGMTGIAVLQALKSDARFRHIPVIMCSAIIQPQSIVECLRIGAEDYVPKPFDKHIFQARVNGCIQRTLARKRELAALTLLQNEFNDARNYIMTRLPAPMESPLKIDYAYRSSSLLGGDTFGYRCLNDRYMIMFLIDISGHGVGSALYAASVNDFLRHSLTLQQNIQPHEIAKILNRNFKMESRAGKYFTLWYGVYDLKLRQLTYICCGHPPALLKRNHSVTQLGVGEMAITGIMSENYPTETLTIHSGDELLLFSDGIYETKLSGVYQNYSDFQNLINRLPDCSANNILREVQQILQHDEFEDDISLMHVSF